MGLGERAHPPPPDSLLFHLLSEDVETPGPFRGSVSWCRMLTWGRGSGAQGCDLGLQAAHCSIPGGQRRRCRVLSSLPQPCQSSRFDLPGTQSSQSLLSASLSGGEGRGSDRAHVKGAEPPHASGWSGV